MRVFQDADPYEAAAAKQPWPNRGAWPCRWIGLPAPVSVPFVAAYRRRFEVADGATIRIHVTADERYELFLDGTRIGRGSERGDSRNWFYETHLLDLAAGPHALVARVWALGGQAPFAQMSVCHGFLCSAEGEFVQLLGTGVADWEVKRLEGYSFHPLGLAWGTGARHDIDGAKYPWGCEAGEGTGWERARPLHVGANGAIKNEYSATHLLKPSTLPPMLEQAVPPAKVRQVEAFKDAETPVHAGNHLAAEAEGWDTLLRGRPLTVPPHTARRVILDLDDYYCAYPQVVTRGGRQATIRLHWAESLYIPGGEPSWGGAEEAARKGHRDEIEGKRFIGVGSTFRTDGGRGRVFEPLWWEAGRYVEVVVRTDEDALVLEKLAFIETRYPLSPESSMDCSDPRWAGVQRMSVRVLQMCSHETYFDCPYYEQLMYVGDTRLQALVTYALTPDTRLPRKALRMFEASHLVDRGLTQSRYPSRTTQIIPPFSLFWTLMVYDHALWRGDRAFVSGLMPGVRTVLETFLQLRNQAGLVQAPDGWNFMDWVPEWTSTTRDVRNWGVPPEGEFGVNGLLQWLVILAFNKVADVEAWLGEVELAARDRRLAADLAKAAEAALWDEQRGLYAEDLAHRHFSEHSQCLAILGGCLSPGRRQRAGDALLAAPGLARATIYFNHYLFETVRLLDRADVLFERMALWYELEAKGLKTTVEEPEPTRSDCHAWGAHPLYHYYATILGIRPAEMGFASVAIRPQLGPLTAARGTLVHPLGRINMDLAVRDGRIFGTVELPTGLSGRIHLGDTVQELQPGNQDVAGRTCEPVK